MELKEKETQQKAICIKRASLFFKLQILKSRINE